MARDRFEFGLSGTPEEIADYLTSVARGLKRGEVSLESGVRALWLVLPGEIKLELKVATTASRGKVKIEIAWKRRNGARAGDLHVEVDAPGGCG